MPSFSPTARDAFGAPARLRVGAELSRGAFSSVHSACCAGVSLALKRSLRPQPCWTESVLRDEHFLRRLAGHGGVLRVEGAFWDSAQQRCLLLPLATADLHHERPADARTFRRVLGQLMRAFRHIHCSGVVHLDVKPQNILVFQPNWRARVADFGSSSHRGHVLDDDKLYECTRPFRAPELMVAGVKRAQPSMDLWSLGVLAWDICPGEELHPLSGAGNSAEQMVLVVALVGCTGGGAWGLPCLESVPPYPARLIAPELRCVVTSLLRAAPQERRLPLLRSKRWRAQPAARGGPGEDDDAQEAEAAGDGVEGGGHRG